LDAHAKEMNTARCVPQRTNRTIIVYINPICKRDPFAVGLPPQLCPTHLWGHLLSPGEAWWARRASRGGLRVRRGLGRRAAGPPASSPYRRPSACLPPPRRSDEFLILLALGWSARGRTVVGAGLGLLLLAPGIATLWTACEKLAAPIAPAAVPSRGPSRVDWEEGSRSPATQESEDGPKFATRPGTPHNLPLRLDASPCG
jgi:hypothetical protein